MTVAGESAESNLDAFRFSSARNQSQSTGWTAGDANFDRTFLVAQAAPANNSPQVFAAATPAGGAVGVQQEFSSWSDLTALFRPSRWKSPIAEGGTLSWLNYNAWGTAPARTGKVLLGEAAVAGALYFLWDAFDDDDGHHHHKDKGGGSSGSGSGGSSSSGGDDGGEMPY